MIQRTAMAQITASPKLVSLMKTFGDPAGCGVAIARAMDKQNQFTVGAVKQKLTGPVLKVDTGTLRRSIGATGAVVVHAGTKLEINSTIGSNVQFAGAQSVVYAAIHEFGGTIKPKAPNKWLRFKTRDGSWHTVKQVVMPERSYLRSTIRERQPRYSAAFVKATKDFYLGKAT